MRLLGALCLVIFSVSCSIDHNKEMEEKGNNEEQYNEEINLLKNYLSLSMQIDTKKIIYDSRTGNFIIDGDVLMPLEEARDHYNHAGSIIGKVNQRGDNHVVSPPVAKIYVSPEVSAEWRKALEEAIKHWNTINASISMSVVSELSSSNMNVRYSNYDENSKIRAYAASPNYLGQPGKFISINPYYNYLLPDVKVEVMVHELGHNFGLNHTNEKAGPQIPCTPLDDETSVMQTYSIKAWKGFTYYDVVAISTLYPMAVGTKKIYRFKKNQSYFYTTNPCEIDPQYSGYVFDGDAGYVYSSPLPGTVPLYRSVNGSSVKDHKLSIEQTSVNDVVIGYLYSSQHAGTTALFRYVSSYEYFPSGQHYLFTTVFDEEYPISFPIGYVYNNIIYDYKKNDIEL